MQKAFIIRPFDGEKQEDYRMLAALYGYAYPEEPITPFELKMNDRSKADDHVCKRFFAEQYGIITGVVCLEHWESFYHPHKFLLHIIVAPKFQHQGMGSELYLNITKQLEKLNPVEIYSWVRSDKERSVRFAEDRNFTKVKSKWNLTLNLNSFRHEQFIGQTNGVRDQGIEIKLFLDLENNFDRDRKFYELYVKTLKSIESAGEPEIPSFDDFTLKKNENAFDMTFIAVHNEKYVGMWQLETGIGTSLFGGAMGVDEFYRQSGIAYALAIRGILYARNLGYDNITAHTDENNRAILKLTEKLGFIRQPAQYLFSKKYEA
jgi:ribosomal protein S18 acetylase RimI-like enzyme